MSGVSRGDSNPAHAGAGSAAENSDLQSRADPQGSKPATVSPSDSETLAFPSGMKPQIPLRPRLQSGADPSGSNALTENPLAPRPDSSESLTRAEFEYRLAGLGEQLTSMMSMLNSFGQHLSSSQSRTASTSGEGTTLASSLNPSDDKPETNANFHLRPGGEFGGPG